MIDNRVCPSVHCPSRDVQTPEPSGPRCSKRLSAASHRSLERPRRVIAANIPHIRVPSDIVVARRPRSVGTQLHDDATELAALLFGTNAGNVENSATADAKPLSGPQSGRCSGPAPYRER